MKYVPMSKKQLAMAYAPELSIGGAVNRLRRWIHINKTLMEELVPTGYIEAQHLLTSRQVEIIMRYLGEP